MLTRHHRKPPVEPLKLSEPLEAAERRRRREERLPWLVIAAAVIVMTLFAVADSLGLLARVAGWFR
jgi:hypothetical protein